MELLNVLRIVVEVEDVEDFFWLGHAHFFQFGVKARVFRSEIRNPKGSRYACSGDD